MELDTMKAQLPKLERTILPANTTGLILACRLCAAMQECKRTVAVRQEVMELESGRINVPLLIVEVGPRPMEGSIAREMKAKASTTPIGRVVMENGVEIRTSLPLMTEQVRERVEKSKAFWKQFEGLK